MESFTFADYPDFMNHFRVEMHEKDIGGGLEYAISGEAAIVSNYIRLPERYLAGDQGRILIRPYEVCSTGRDLYEFLNSEAARLLITTGCDRNEMIYDSKEESGKMTRDLMFLMRKYINKNRSKSNHNTLTDIYMRNPGQDGFPGSPYLDAEVHYVPSNLWNRLEDFYSRELGGNYPENKKNLILGVCDSSEFQCPMHKINEETTLLSMIVLNYENVVLGAY